MHILGLLQARVGSSRLPGKVLKPILGQPMLLRQLERVRRARSLEHLIVATSTDPADDALEQLCGEGGVECFRGSLNDVLDRFYQAALPFAPQHIVRLTGDCPLADPDLIDRVVRFHLDGDYDDVGNAVEATFPDGLDVEVVRFPALEQAWREARTPFDREHVTMFIHANPARFRIGSYQNDVNLSHLRWTVDEPDDFALVEAIYEALYPANPTFTTADVLDLLDIRPELSAINQRLRRFEGVRQLVARTSTDGV
jgi:spore coat polysaccharide biosynthesis protein SpsF